MTRDLRVTVVTGQSLYLQPLALRPQAQRQLRLCAAVGAQSAEIHAAGLRSDQAALEQHGARAALGEMIGGAGAGNAAANDDHIHFDLRIHPLDSCSSRFIHASIDGIASAAAATYGSGLTGA